MNCYRFKDILIVWPDALTEDWYLIINLREGERRVGGEGINVEDSRVCVNGITYGPNFQSLPRQYLVICRQFVAVRNAESSGLE